MVHRRRFGRRCMMSNTAIEIYESDDGNVRLNVQIDGETVWLTQPQMSVLFGRDVSVIRKHIKNLYAEGELDELATKAKFALVQNEGRRGTTYTQGGMKAS